MKATTQAAAICCLLPTLCGSALADGVDLIASAAANPADAARIAELKDHKLTKRVVGAFSVNRSAIVGNIVNVTIEGKTYRFSRTELPDAGVPGVESWYGRTPRGDTAIIAHDRTNGSVLARFSAGWDQFELRPVGSTYVLYAIEMPKGPFEPKSPLPGSGPGRHENVN